MPFSRSYSLSWCTQRLPTNGTSQTMRGVANHVALIKVVRHDLGVVKKRETKIEKLFWRGVDAAQEYSLISNVAKTNVEQFADGLGDQWRHLAGVIDVRVEREVDAALV